MSTARALLALCIMAAVCDAKLKFLSSKPVTAAEAHTREREIPVFRRSYSSGSATTSTSGSASGTSPTPTPPASPTPAPTPAATEAGGTQIVQVITMASPFTTANIANYGASAYATAVNFGYGSSIGIVTSTASATAYKTGCSVSSTATVARRADLSITFTAIVSAAEASAATSASQSLTASSLSSAVTSVIANLKQSDAATFGSLASSYNVSSVATPTATTVGGSASANAVFSAMALLSAAALTLKQ